MTEEYVIVWESQTDRYRDRIGMKRASPKRFTKEEADALVAELNADYPHIRHEAIVVESTGTQ